MGKGRPHVHVMHAIGRCGKWPNVSKDHINTKTFYCTHLTYSKTMASTSLGEGLLNSDEGTAMLSSSVRRSQLDKVKESLRNGPFALKSLCFMACLACIIYNCFDVFHEIMTINVNKLLVVVFAVGFSLIGLILEVTPIVCTKRCRHSIEHWVKLFSRTKGRGILYLFLGAIQLSAKDFSDFISTAIGISLVCCGVFSFLVSIHASQKLNRLHAAMIQGHTDDLVYARSKFNEFDADNSGALEAPELAACAASLGSELSSNELVAIFSLLDVDHNGKVDFEEFENWWSGKKTDFDYSMV